MAHMALRACRHRCGDRQEGNRDPPGGVWARLQGGGSEVEGGAAERRQHPLYHPAVGEGRMKALMTARIFSASGEGALRWD